MAIALIHCAQCQSEVEKGDFCPKCGHEHGKPDDKSKTEDNDESWLKKRDLESRNKAQEHLRKLKNFFWGIGFGSMMMRGLGESGNDLYSVLILPYIGLVIYFITFSVKTLKMEKLSKWNAIWVVFFAPLSWFYIYPLMANPLKEIIHESNEQILNKSKQKEFSAKERKYFWIGIAIIVLCLSLIIIASFIDS